MGQAAAQGLGALFGGTVAAGFGIFFILLARSKRSHPDPKFDDLAVFRAYVGGVALSVLGLFALVVAAVTTPWYWAVGYAGLVVVAGAISRRVFLAVRKDANKKAKVRDERVAILTAEYQRGSAAAAGDLSGHRRPPVPENMTSPLEAAFIDDHQQVEEGWFATLQRVMSTPIAAPDVETRAMLQAVNGIRERYAGRTFAPASSLPASKEALLRAVLAQRTEVRPASRADRELRGIILELECFIPDELAARTESIEHPSAMEMRPGMSENVASELGYHLRVLDSIARAQADTAVLLHQDVRDYTAEGVVHFLDKDRVKIGSGQQWLETLDDDQAEVTFIATGAMASGVTLLVAFIAWTQKLFGIQTWELVMIIPVWVIGISFGRVGVWIHHGLRSRGGRARRVADGVSVAAVAAFPSLFIVGFHVTMLRLGLVP